jgi:SNF2 family DNA or RNA helicase
MHNKTINSDILKPIIDFVDQEDLDEGFELFSSEKMININSTNGLLTTKFSSLTEKSVEVRAKLNNGSSGIQWIECGCSKNRKTSQYCEHIIAFLLHLSKNPPKFVNYNHAGVFSIPKPPERRKIYKKDPLKPPPIAGSNTEPGIFSKPIISISPLGKNPGIRVRIEIKSDLVTHQDLTLDDAALFLSKNAMALSLLEKQHQLSLYNCHGFFAIYLKKTGTDTIKAEKVFAWKKETAPDKDMHDPKHPKEALCGFAAKKYQPPPSCDSYEMLPYHPADCFIGEKYCFFSDIGYISLRGDHASTKWLEEKIESTYSGDRAALLVENKYADLLDIGPLLIDSNLVEGSLLQTLTLKSIEVHEHDGTWFYISPIYNSGNAEVSMLDIIKHRNQNKRQYLATKQGWIKIPDILQDLNFSIDESQSKIKASTIDIIRFKAATGEFDQFSGTKKILDILREKTTFDKNTVLPSLAHTHLNLRNYQQEGAAWLWWLYKNGMHGMLADEMGLGKTHQAMALLAAIHNEKANARLLVICPTSVLNHWMDKMQEFAPVLKPILYYGSKRQKETTLGADITGVILTSYGVLIRDIRRLRDIHWDAVIVDEAHFAKNSNTSTYQALCRLNCDLRVCLTGTPMENHIGELKNIFDFLLPGLLGSDKYFRKNFQIPIENDRNLEVAGVLQRTLLPFKFRRIKKDVLQDLPEKIEDIRHCNLSDEQAALYQKTLSLKAASLIDSLIQEKEPIPYLHVFATLSLLKQICNHPALVIPGSSYQKHTSNKFELLKELFDEAISSDLKVVVFSQYVKMIEIISNYLTEQQIVHSVLTGKSKNRGEIISNFQNNPENKVFVGSLLAGGIGIDLTAASVVIHFDRWWNPSKENQATDRVHRFGQNKNVQVIKLITKGTLEEKIDQIISGKKDLIDQFVENDHDFFKKFDRKELINLLS